ncbi:MAG TPA: hypothetical protein EYP80_02160 [Candidatus Aenigmarchaeota archaeon]|nr:hypothetical protein [Candidatus Aenigmarchaeota archaeon]
MKVDILNILLKSHRISKHEFSKYAKLMKEDPIGFILNEEDPDVAKRKNIVKSIMQILYQFDNHVIEKPEFDHINMIFLGVAAGGYAVCQGSRTGGFIVNVGDKRLHVDPGISAVKDCRDYTRCSNLILHPVLTDALLVTHHHIDHAGGVEEYLENWLPFRLKKVVIANRTVIEGNFAFEQGPRLDKYKKAAIKTYTLKQGDRVSLDNINVRATRAVHVEAFDPVTKNTANNCIGFVIETPFGVIGVTGDSEYYEAITNEFADVDYLIAYVVQERSRVEAERYSSVEIRSKVHHTQFLGEIGVEKLLKEVKPKICFLTHYGDQFATLENGKLIYKDIPIAIAKRIQNNTGVKTIACLCGMSISIKRRVDVTTNFSYFYS